MLIATPFPFMKARHIKRHAGVRAIRLIVMHSMEFPEKGDTAESCARYFQNPLDAHNQPRPASAHICVDCDSIIQCVPDNDIAAAAPGSNEDGLHIELAGYARQSEAEWLDEYGKALLDNAAQAAARFCLRYSLPVVRLSDSQLADRSMRGFVSHAQVSAVFKRSTHTDPGPGFPWTYFLAQVSNWRTKFKQQ